ncbi:hypothetical protein FFLO_04807 [Filobasidium floriforme]|uniref:Chromatin modification-related protein EAF3 n=1 Tax=Filobasidium floriforme TaxID=5210 RepID=A0A8K0JI67_9TREE|nr:MRG-domain-containing protein [Filobasidium floriforme]KAG7530765.1 hypothetical protein FFLO_04807 [Filobasidium floriforme]KAH8081187.1 MRG-domain-containing protein [Filobasidium floriforme]
MAFNYTQKENVLCFHGPLIYEAQVLDTVEWDAKETKSGVVGPHYRVHYKGWRKSWDEWVPETRLMKDDKAGRDKQKRLREEAIAAQTAAKLAKSGATEKASSRSDAASPAPNGTDKGKAAVKQDTKGKKRTRGEAFDTEEQYLKRPEVKIPIPDVLRVKLVDDWEAVTKNNQLVTLPRTPNVKEIIEEYKEYCKKKRADKKATRADALLEEIMAGLVVYFDKCLGNNLLYRFERAQYVNMRKETKEEKAMSEIYGAEHLLRLFVNLPSFIAHTNMDTESINLLRDHLAEFMKWMIKELDRLFQKEYENTTTQYQNLSRA